MVEDDKIWSWLGLALVAFGVIGVNGMISSLFTDFDCTLTIDTFAIGVGLILWRISERN